MDASWVTLLVPRTAFRETEGTDRDGAYPKEKKLKINVKPTGKYAMQWF